MFSIEKEFIGFGVEILQFIKGIVIPNFTFDKSYIQAKPHLEV